jgi:hypothetical protein
MPALRSRAVTHGRNMFVPGHVHLREVGQVVSDAIAHPDK